MKIIRLNLSLISLVLFTLTSIGPAQSTETVDADKLAADQAACQEHAKASSGYDPSAPSTESKPQRGAGLRGAARGAAKGAIAGGTVEVIGDDSKYDDAAEIAAGVGAVAGGAKARRRAKEEAQAAPAGDSSAYTKYYNECMQSRGHATE